MCTAVMDMMTGGMAASMAGWMLVWTLLTVGALAFGINWLVRRRREPANAQPALENTPTDILRRRYATGEIDEDEYLTRLSGLTQR